MNESFAKAVLSLSANFRPDDFALAFFWTIVHLHMSDRKACLPCLRSDDVPLPDYILSTRPEIAEATGNTSGDLSALFPPS